MEDVDKELKKQVIEELAAIEHERWADWQKYLHSNCIDNVDGGKTIPSKLYLHWQRQINTKYADLTEKEKDSDREQVDRYWPIIQNLLTKCK